MRSSRHSALAAAFAFTCASAAGQDPAASFERIVERRLAESEIPACIAVALVGETVQKRFACTPRAGPPAFDERSIFEIGSITKGFTGLLLADMVRRGEVSPGDPVSKYAPAGAKLPRRGEEEITLLDLATQTSGLPRMPARFSPASALDPYADFTADRLYEALAQAELHPQKGRPEYSNFGYMWLSEMLGRRGKSYAWLLRERVLEPLGMNDTWVEVPAQHAARIVKGHGASYDPVPPWRFATNLEGVGGLRSTLADMVKLGQALSGRVETPLKETIALALQPLRPAFGNNSTGYGWITHELKGVRFHWHNGGTGGFRSIIAVNPATRTSAIVLADSIASFDDLAMHLVDPERPLHMKRRGLPSSVDLLRQYAGRYELVPGFAVEVFVDGERLMAQATGQGAFEVAREGTDTFFAYVVPAKLRFSRGADGQVDGVTLEQGGREMRGRRGPSAR